MLKRSLQLLCMYSLILNSTNAQPSLLSRASTLSRGLKTVLGKKSFLQKTHSRKNSTQANQHDPVYTDGDNLLGGVIVGYGTTAAISSLVFAYNVLDDGDTKNAIKLTRSSAAMSSVSISPIMAGVFGGIPGLIGYIATITAASGAYALYKEGNIKRLKEFFKIDKPEPKK